MPDVTSRPFSELFGGRPGDGSLASLARAAARAGYAVMPIAPGEKRPLCVLTERQQTKADKDASHAARDAGKRNWERVRHPCGIKHATTDEKEAHRWFKRLAEENPGLNLAADVYRSHALVVDADTAAELASFTTLWARKEGVEDLMHAAPTVRSPGARDEHGTWKHSEGGHYWFLLPEDVELGDLAGVTSIPIGTDPDHPAQLKVSGYVLVPPSVRAEGEYRMASDAHVAPGWLVDLVTDHLTGRRETREKRRDQALDADDHIRLAQSTISWSSILVPRGWVDSGKSSRCGCAEWTAPGDHASTKSATAHDAGCAEFDTVDGFIHIWTDNPPGDLAAAGAKTFSKLQFIAWHDYGGDVGEAMAELGIERQYSANEPRVLTRDEIARAMVERAAASEDELEDGPDEPEDEQHTSWWFKDLGPVLSGENLEPEPSVLTRSDGRGLFYPGKVNGIIAPSESGKSWIALAAVAQELRARRPVLYIDFEDTAEGIVGRLRVLGVPDDLMAPSAGLLRYVGPEEALHSAAYGEYAEALVYQKWSVIVFDGVNVAMTLDGLDLISNTDANKFFTKVTRPAASTGATVIQIDHVPKDPEKRGKGGIGAQAKRASITGAQVYMDVEDPFGRGKSGSLTLIVDKDRPGHVRGASNAEQVWAEVKVNAISEDRVSIELNVPDEVTKAGTTSDQAHEYRVKVLTYLKEITSEVSGRRVREEVTGTDGKIQEALNWLVENGYVGRRVDPRNRRVHLNSYLRDYPSDGPTVLRPPASDDPFGGS